MKAAVLRAYKTPVEIEDLEVADPGPREVRVRTRACGVCHSDLHVFEGSLPVPIPTVLGHEPAGVVEEVGSLVTHAAPGDRLPLGLLWELPLLPRRQDVPVRRGGDDARP